jgi:hypothetical protein
MSLGPLRVGRSLSGSEERHNRKMWQKSRACSLFSNTSRWCYTHAHPILEERIEPSQKGEDFIRTWPRNRWGVNSMYQQTTRRGGRSFGWFQQSQKCWYTSKAMIFKTFVKPKYLACTTVLFFQITVGIEKSSVHMKRTGHMCRTEKSVH